MIIPNVLQQLASSIDWPRTQEEADQRFQLFIAHQGEETTIGYQALADLLRQGYFSLVVTSNPRNDLEDALAAFQWFPQQQYEVLVVGQTLEEEIGAVLEGARSGVHLVKLAPELAQNSLTPLSSTLSKSLRDFFSRKQNLIVGSLEREKEAIAALCSYEMGDGGLYSARQSLPASDDIIMDCLIKQKKRPEFFLIAGPDGAFDTFFPNLRSSLEQIASGRERLEASRPEPKPPSRNTPRSDSRSAKEEYRPSASEKPPISPEKAEDTSKVLKLLYLHVSQDDTFLEGIQKQLAHLRKHRQISEWDSRKLMPGSNQDQEIHRHLQEAEIILLLVSADFLDDNNQRKYVEEAMRRSRVWEAEVIPILVRSCIWTEAEFNELVVLPIDHKPVALWEDKDDAYYNIGLYIDRTIKKKSSSRPS